MTPLLSPAVGSSHQTTSLLPPLSALEISAIDLFVRVAQLLGTSKSIGEIYGLLFVSPVPISGEDVRAKLQISSGSASQGLRLLRSVGAVLTVYVPGERRDHYVAETGLQKIASGFLREKIAPHLSDHGERIARLARQLAEMPVLHRTVLEERMQILQDWRRQATAILPMVMHGIESNSAASAAGAQAS